jgi:hypothetical protein
MRLKTILRVAVIASLAITPALFAQNGFDMFGIPRAVVLSGGTALDGAVTVSNNPVDIRVFNGIASIIAVSATNGASGVVGATTLKITTGSDLTNWTAITNLAITTASSLTATNGMYGNTNLIATNSWLLPGVITYPTAYSAGFSTPYMAPAQFTNTTVTLADNSPVAIGFPIENAGRYIRAQWTTTGTTTNTGTAILLGRANFP